MPIQQKKWLKIVTNKYIFSLLGGTFQDSKFPIKIIQRIICVVISSWFSLCDRMFRSLASMGLRFESSFSGIFRVQFMIITAWWKGLVFYHRRELSGNKAMCLSTPCKRNWLDRTYQNRLIIALTVSEVFSIMFMTLILFYPCHHLYDTRILKFAMSSL